MAFQHCGFDPHLRNAKFLGSHSRQFQEAGKFLVALPVGNAIVDGFAEALPAHDGSEMRGLPFRDGPFREKYRRQRFQPWPPDVGNRAIHSADPPPESEASLAPRDALGQPLVTIGDADLGETGVHIQEDPPPRLVVFFSPDPKRHRAHHQQVRLRAEREEAFQRRASRAAVCAINPFLMKPEWLKAFPDVSGRVAEIQRPFLLVPIVNPGTISAVFEVENLVAERPETEEVLETGQACPPRPERPMVPAKMIFMQIQRG